MKVNLTVAQRHSLALFAENPHGGSYRGPKGKLCWARPETLARLGLLVRREPAGTGWELTDTGRAALGKREGPRGVTPFPSCRYCGGTVPARPVQRFCEAKTNPFTFCRAGSP